MRISAKSDYAVRAVLEIARAPGSTAMTSEDIGAAQSIPRTFLLTILGELRRAGIVGSRRGQSGGWSLNRPADRVTLADIIRAVDGPLASIQGWPPERVEYVESAAALQTVWIALRASLREVLETVTVEHLMTGSLPTLITDRADTDDAWHAR